MEAYGLGQGPQLPTCKHVVKRDLVLLSPGARALVRRARIQQHFISGLPGGTLLLACSCSRGHASPTPSLDPLTNSTEWFRSFGSTLEKCLNQAFYTEPKRKPIAPPVLRPSRPGEEPSLVSAEFAACRCDK